MALLPPPSPRPPPRSLLWWPPVRAFPPSLPTCPLLLALPPSPPPSALSPPGWGVSAAPSSGATSGNRFWALLDEASLSDDEDEVDSGSGSPAPVEAFVRRLKFAPGGRGRQACLPPPAAGWTQVRRRGRRSGKFRFPSPAAGLLGRSPWSSGVTRASPHAPYASSSPASSVRPPSMGRSPLAVAARASCGTLARVGGSPLILGRLGGPVPGLSSLAHFPPLPGLAHPGSASQAVWPISGWVFMDTQGALRPLAMVSCFH